MTNPAVLAINASIGKEAASKVTGLEEKVKASMRGVIRGNWMDTSDDGIFRAGLGGALLDLGKDSEDGQRLLASIEALTQFSAFLSAAMAGLSVEPPNTDGHEDLLPLMKWWHEVKAES